MLHLVGGHAAAIYAEAFAAFLRRVGRPIQARRAAFLRPDSGAAMPPPNGNKAAGDAFAP